VDAREGVVRGLYRAPAIPADLEAAVRRVHGASLPAAEPVLVLYDDTVFGTGENGFVLTPRRICWKALGEAPVSLPWKVLRAREERSEGCGVVISAGRLPLTGWDEAMAERLAVELCTWVERAAGEDQAYRTAARERRAWATDDALALVRRHLRPSKRMHVHPDVRSEIEAMVRRVHGLGVAEVIVAVYDASLLGGGAEGFVVTTERLCWKNLLEAPVHVRWDVLSAESVVVVGASVRVAGGSVRVGAGKNEVASVFAGLALG
jgi:hypothetical protein